jgi:hypothetical protein
MVRCNDRVERFTAGKRGERLVVLSYAMVDLRRA